MATNKFDQLVEDLLSNELTLTQVQIAMRTFVRRRKDIPEGIKDILCGRAEGASGLIGRMFKSIQDVIGAVELAYRRGGQRDPS